MSAIIGVYTDTGCTKRLLMSGTVYDLFLGPEIGLEGNTGDQADTIIYIRNDGDKTASEVKLVFNNNPNNMLTAKIGDSAYSGNTITIGTLAHEDTVNGVSANIVPVYLRLTVPTATLMTSDRPNISFIGKSNE